MNRRARGVLAKGCLVAVLAVSGCAGYRLGSTLPPGLKTIYVPTFVNNTREPQLESEATQAVLQEFQKDGSLSLTTADRADAILRVSLVSYRLVPLRYDKDRAKTTREYRLKLQADVECTRTDTGDVLVSRRVSGESTFEPVGDLSSAKRDALPEAARDLAHDIVESVVETW